MAVRLDDYWVERLVDLKAEQLADRSVVPMDDYLVGHWACCSVGHSADPSVVGSVQKKAATKACLKADL